MEAAGRWGEKNYEMRNFCMFIYRNFVFLYCRSCAELEGSFSSRLQIVISFLCNLASINCLRCHSSVWLISSHVAWRCCLKSFVYPRKSSQAHESGAADALVCDFFCIFVQFHFNFIKTPKKAELRVFHVKLILHLNCMQFIFIRGIRNYQIARSEAWNFWNFLNSPPFSFFHCRLCVGWAEIGKQGKRHGRWVNVVVTLIN